MFKEVLNLCFFLIQCGQKLDEVVDLLLATFDWIDINQKDLFILIYLSASHTLRANLLEQYGFANCIPFIFLNGENKIICPEVLDFIKP